MPRYLLALDQGTTSSRAILFDREGAIARVAQREYPQYYPQPGWVEQEPEEIWSSQLAVAREVLAGLPAGEVAALGLANQRETTLLWDRRTGAPVHRAIVWQDRRTAPLCEELQATGHEALFQQKTGLLLDPYFSGTKLRWLLDQVPGARARAERGELAFGTVDTWLLWKLTGGARHLTDASNASRTLLFDLHTGAWDDELLALLRIPRAVLPEVRGSSEIYGHTAEGILAEPLAIAGMAGDQQAATFGQACTQPGLAKNTYGTGCFLLLQTGEEAVASRHRLLTTVAWRLGGKLSYALEGSVFVGGAVVQWLRDGLGVIRTADEIEALAAQVPDAGGVHFIPAFAGMGAPYWDPHARGTISGLTRGTTRAHLARAALESIALQSAELLEAMERDSGRPVPELRVDGGAARNDLLMQLQADLLGIPVVRPQITETTALGAAYLAGLATGFWQELPEWRIDRRFEPRLSANERTAKLAAWKTAVRRALSEPAAR